MQRQLISQDIHLLKEIAELGDVSPRVFDQNRRLERLELEGLVSASRPVRVGCRSGLGLPAHPQGTGYRIQTVNLIYRDG